MAGEARPLSASNDATAEELAEAKLVHKAWASASSALGECEIALKEAQRRAEYAREFEAAATKAYLDFHDAYWAKRGMR